VAAASRKRGSDLGRPALDWEQAFGFYASLPAERRSYRVVAAEFGVSARTVERHGRCERWRERVQRIEAEARLEAERRLGRARADQLTDLQKLIEASFIRYAQQLRSGEVRLSAGDLPRLFKLLQELWQAPSAPDEQPARKARARVQPSVEHMLEVVAALHESGVLAAGDRDQGRGEPEGERDV